MEHVKLGESSVDLDWTIAIVAYNLVDSVFVTKATSGFLGNDIKSHLTIIALPVCVGHLWPISW